MIRAIQRHEIEQCVEVIRTSFLTVAKEYGFTEENAPRFTAFSTTVQRLNWQYKSVTDANNIPWVIRETMVMQAVRDLRKEQSNEET